MHFFFAFERDTGGGGGDNRSRFSQQEYSVMEILPREAGVCRD